MTHQLVPGQIEDTPLAEALGERYLAYALSTITSRSLPDVRDGLKPVQRRLLYAMQQLRLDPKSGFKKCARVVGDVIGKYHPHGDTAVYDAMVRLAQDFAVRYPLVDGQGNFGNIDGDNAAAMRYTEARLTEVATLMLADLDADTVDFRANYDGTDEEPVVLPAGFPNLLANGANGIAVGMATSIPPHNVAELCDALRHMLKFKRVPDGDDRYPTCTVESLVERVKGPDFPTGGVIVEDADSIMDAYRTGRGGFRVRARWEVEKRGHGGYQIVVTEIPYQVQKSRLIEKVADLLSAKKLALVADIRDESAEEVRIVIEPRSRNVEPELLMESLFRQTDFETRVPLNLNVLDATGVPRVMGLKEALASYLDHRFEILQRRSRHRLARIAHRLEVLRGQMIVYLNLDEVIRIIREGDEPKADLMARFELSEVQADAILNMRLRSLHKLQEIEIRKEIDGLEAEQSDLEALLADEKRQGKVISDELKAVGKTFAESTPLGRRRTDFAEAPEVDEVPAEALIEREPITVILSQKGWIRAMKGHIADDQEVRFKEGDDEHLRLRAETTDKLLLLATNGRVYTLGCDKLPPGRGFGEPLRLMIDLDNEHDIVAAHKYRAGGEMVIASSDGRGFLVKEDGIIAQTRSGKQLMNVSGKARVALFQPVPEGADHVAVIGDNRKLLVFKLEELPEMSRGKGVKLQSYRQGGLSDLKLFKLEDGLTWKSGQRMRTETDLLPWRGRRGNIGRLPPNGFPRSNKFGE